MTEQHGSRAAVHDTTQTGINKITTEIYEDGALEIEVSGADGGTVAIFVAQPYEVEPDPE